MSLGGVLNELVLGGAALGAVVYIGRQFGRLVSKIDGIAAAPADIARVEAIVAKNTVAIEKLTRQMAKLTRLAEAREREARAAGR